jgi:hypothetical protein
MREMGGCLRDAGRPGPRSARWNARKALPLHRPSIGGLKARLLFELDDVDVVVDADGVQFPEDVLAKEAVELDAEDLA